MLGRRWFAWLLVALAPLASGCGSDEPKAGMPEGPAPRGAPCTRTEDCRSRLCLEVAPGRGVCTNACTDATDCPASPGWICAQPNEVAVSVCACRASAEVEICGDGIDNECNGIADDCRICEGQAVAPDDPRHCGVCGNACSSEQRCLSGKCECPASTPVTCGQDCVDLQTDPLNCGTCGIACGTERSCVAGKCECTGATEVYCDGTGCVDTSTDAANCGECGTTCATGLVCTDGECSCATSDKPDFCDGTGCVTLATDTANCGECGNRCPALEQTCVEGKCECPVDLPDLCDGSCRALATSDSNCGECGHVCQTGTTCQSGVCTCPGGTEECGGVCVSTSTDSGNCGVCFNACKAGEQCRGGSCSCDGLLCGDVCLTSVDPRNCGACGNACGPTQFCSGGACRCPGTLDTLCGTDCANLQTSAAHCGNCATPCAPGQLCEAGQCKAVSCTPSTRSCVNGDVFSCSASGTTLTLYDDCTTGEYCATASGSASCLPDVCVQGTPLCNGTVATTCAADGSRFEPGGTDCAATSKACEAGVCKPIVCTPNEETCVGQTARRCNALGTVLTQTPCTSTQYCAVAGIAYCATDVCTQGQFACDGNVATTCNADGSGFTGTRRDCTPAQDECRDGYCHGFGTAAPRDQTEGTTYPAGAMDRTGSVLLVWSSGTSVSPFTAKFSRFDGTTGVWSAAAPVTGLTAGSRPVTVVATSGNNFVVLWHMDQHLHASVFTTSTKTWSAPKRVDTAAAPAEYARITIDGKDVVTVAWYQEFALWVSRRNPANDTWTTGALPPIGSTPEQLPGIGADAAGNVMVVWCGNTAAHYNRFDAQTLTWMPASQTFSSGSVSYRSPKVEVRPDGGAIAMWSRIDSTSPSVVFTRFDPGTKTWSAVNPIIGMNAYSWNTAAGGNARLLGVTDSGGQTYAYFFDDATRTWGPGTGVSTVSVSPDSIGAVSTDGSAMVFASGSTGLFTTRFSPVSSTWDGTVSHGGTGFDFGKSIWMDGGGNAIIAWQRSTATTSAIMVNRFTRYR